MGVHVSNAIQAYQKHMSLIKFIFNYNCQSLDLMSVKSCVGIFIFFYFSEYGKPGPVYMQKKYCLQKKQKKYFLFIDCTELNWGGKDANGLCVYIFFKNMGVYLGVIGKLHNYEGLIYIFTGGFLNGTPNIFNKSYYHFWYK